MRQMWIGALAVVAALACGKKAADTSAQQPAVTTPAAPTGPVVEVKMIGNGTTQAKFEPNPLTIAPGSTVRFVNTSGGPHNIAFYADSIPAGAATALNAGMANRMDNLTGPFLTTPNENYDVSFAGAATGTYKGFCVPHAALGMKLTITVK
jgi:plastocyanin